MTIVEILTSVSQAAKKADKVAILKANRSPVLDKVFDYAYNPDKTFGVTSNQVNGGTYAFYESKDIGERWDMVENILDSLAERKITGAAARNLVLDRCGYLDKESQAILMNILDKNLKIGVSLDQYQKEVMGIKPTKFEVTLAQHLEDAKGVDPLDGTYFASRKCDGVRCTAFYNSSTKEVVFKSRQGKEFTTLDNLKDPVRNFCKGLGNTGEWVLDGELCKVDENGDEHFDQIVGECKKKNYTITDCCYQLFDITSKAVFDRLLEEDIVKFDTRYELLKDLEQMCVQVHTGCWIKILEQERITCQADFDRWEKKVADGGWEGFMLRKNVPFETGRTKNLLKVKKFHDAEYVVEGTECGEITTSEPGKGNVTYYGVTALHISHKGKRVSVGSGMTREQRKEWYEDASKIVGKTICVKYFQESTDKDGNVSLRFPTLKHVYENGRNV